MPSRYAAARSHALSSENDCTPADKEVRAGLETLLNSSAFSASSRNRRFLAYVVEETLAGRGDHIKAYNIAVSAFERADDFDPLTDPIVRIEAARLRRSIEHYYLTAGRNDRIRINIPKGSYVATFGYSKAADGSTNQPEAAADKPAEPKNLEAPDLGPQPPRATSRKRRVILPIAAALVVALLALCGAYDVFRSRYAAAPDGSSSIRIDQIEADPDNAKQFALVRALNYELISQLANQNHILVYAPDFSAALPSDFQSIAPDYILSGFAQSEGTTVRITVQLTDWRNGRAIWGSNFDADMTAAQGFHFRLKTSEDIVDAILRQVDPSPRAQAGRTESLEATSMRKLR